MITLLILLIAFVLMFILRTYSLYKTVDKNSLIFSEMIPQPETAKINLIVALFITQYRTWDYAAKSQLELLEKLADDCIIGAHTWEKSEIPIDLQKFKYKITQTENISDKDYSSDMRSKEYITTWYKRQQVSTKNALENAEFIYKQTHDNNDMPDDQIVIIMRPDSTPKVDNFPLVPIKEDNFVMATSQIKIESIESQYDIVMNNIIYITTKKTILKIYSIDIELFWNKLKDIPRSSISTEILFYKILEDLNIKPIFNFDMKFGVFRDPEQIQTISA